MLKPDSQDYRNHFSIQWCQSIRMHDSEHSDADIPIRDVYYVAMEGMEFYSH